jgi:ABC-type branched-subunit amino acid transport system ATPase component/ABC-type branched-subunit amino acid transport system permease subunit
VLLAVSARQRGVAAFGALGLLYVIGGRLLPRGLPVEVLLPGLISGGLTAFTAFGLILIFRSARVINFAQANMAGFATTLTVLLVGVQHWSYWAAVPTGLVVAMLLGLWVERGLLGRLRHAPRLIVTVATIGIAQLLGGLTLYISGLPLTILGWTAPQLFKVPAQVGTATPFRMPLAFHARAGTLTVTADYLAAAAAIPIVLVGLKWFFDRTDSGIGARALADSEERALLLGIPVRRLSLITWMIASLLAAVGTILQAGVQGFQANVPVGPEALIAPLAAAVIAGFERLTIAFIASIVLGIVQQALFWSYADPSLVDLALFALILGALLFHRRASARTGGAEGGGFGGVAEPRPLPPVIRRLPEVRAAQVGGGLITLGIACLLPLNMNSAQLTFASFVAIFIVVGASLVILTGWAGQVSLGHFGLVGLGAGTTGWLLTSHHLSLLVCLGASILVGALAALAIGLPALRIRGMYLAVATLAFAAPASSFFLSPAHFPAFAPVRVQLPVLLDRFDLNQPRVFYYFCLVFVLVSLGVIRNFRRSRFGRAAIALRDNERFAAAVSISDTRVRLATFAVSGALAGLGGGLYVLALRGIPFGGFAPVFSLEAFTMVVVGGMGSVWGAVLGAMYLYGTEYFLGPTAQLLTAGGGIVMIVTLAPGGLADLGYRGRDLLITALLRRRGMSPNLLFGREDDSPIASGGSARSSRWSPRLRLRRSTADAATNPPADDELLHLVRVEAGYGHLQILFGVSLATAPKEILALLGTNGAGKSTILKVIAGLLPARRGGVFFRGEDVTRLTPAARVSRGMVMVPARAVFSSLSVAENLRLAGWLAKRRGERPFLLETTAKIHELFPVLGERADQKAGLLSGGEQQMLAIAQALLCRPQLLMIDELSLGLAPTVVATLLNVLRGLNAEGISVVMVEQSINVARSLAPQAVFLEKGEIRFTGPTAELANDSHLVRAVFLAPVKKQASGPRLTRVVAAAVQANGAHSSTTVLEARGLTRSFGGVAAVNAVDLTLEDGKILGVIGANGAGKTTLFDIICGFVTPDSGRLFMDGRDITGLSPAKRFRLGLGRTFQDLVLVPSLTVSEVLSVALERHIRVRDPLAAVAGLGASLQSEAEIRAKVEAAISAFHLERFANSFVSELSTGTRRIVELAAASVHRPRVLVLDEPSSGLAQREAEALIPILLDLRADLGATVAIIEHDIPMIRALSDEVLCMHLGKVLARGPAAEVMADPAVIASYLGTDEVAIERSGGRAAVPA